MTSEYRRTGFQIVPGFLCEARREALLADIQAVFANRWGVLTNDVPPKMLGPEDMFEMYGRFRSAYVECLRAIQNLPAIYEIGTFPAMLDLVHSFGLRSPAYATRPIVLLNSERTAAKVSDWKTPPHQDWRSMQGSLNGLVAWVALTDAPQEVGPLEVLPGSHRFGLLPAEEDDWYMHIPEGALPADGFVSVPVRAGDAVIFSAFLVHRSGTNLSDRIRYSLQFRFNDLAEDTYVRRGYPNPYVTRAHREVATPGYPSSEEVNRVFGSD